MESYAKRADGAQLDKNAVVDGISESNMLEALFENKSVASNQTDSWRRRNAAPYMLLGVKLFTSQAHVGESDFADILNNAPSYCLCTVKEDFLFVLASSEDARQIINSVNDKGKSSRFSIAFSLPFSNLNAVSQQYKLVCFCLASASQGSVCDAQSVALAYLVSEIASSIEVASLLHPALEKLERYDKANQSSLLETLEAYLNHDCNAQRCANELYLHRNSLQYRVRRIQEIAGVSLDKPEERAYLRLSFLLKP